MLKLWFWLCQNTDLDSLQSDPHLPQSNNSNHQIKIGSHPTLFRPNGPDSLIVVNALSEHVLYLHFPTLIWRLLIPTLTFSTVDSFLISFGADSLQFSQGCCRYCCAVGRFSGAKSKSGKRNSENSWASFAENLYLSISNLSSGQNFSLRILFRSPCRSK